MADYSLEEQQRLNRTQDIRDQLMTSLLKNGRPPEDPQMMELLLKVADSSDKQTFTKKRLQTEDKNADTQRQTMEIAKKMLLDKKQRRSKEADESERDIGNVEPENVVPGMTDVGVQAFSYEAFMAGDDKPLPKAAL